VAYDACIIGAGPAGCIAANKGCKENDIVLIGKRASKVQCAGLISKSGLSRLGLVDDAYVLNEVRGARFYSPDNTIFEVDAQKTVAHVVDRIGFDHHLLDMAVDAGVEYREDRVVDFSRTIELGCGDKVDAERIVLATGSDYSMHSQFGFKRPGEILVGMQYEMKLEADSDFVELYFNVPDFFSWVIPLGDTARIGLCTKGNPRPFMESFVKRLRNDKRIKSDKIISESYGIIPVYDPSYNTQNGKVIAIGDAACQVKASTGGGIIMGGIAAEHIFSEDYDSSWRKEIGRELGIHLYIHRFLAGLSDSNKNRLFNILKSVRGNLEKGGDMDYASKVIRSMASNPRFALKFLYYSPSFLMDLL